MSSLVAEGAIRRIAKEARKAGLHRVATGDTASRSYEHPAYRPPVASSGRGVLVALAQAGIHLTDEQRLAVKRLMRSYPELAEHPFTPTTAVEHLILHGIQFTEAQLALVSDECSVSVRYIRSGFDQPRTTGSNPAHQPRRRTTVELEQPGFFGWVRRLFSGRRESKV